MLLFMWVHYHPAQLGLSEFTLDDLTSHDGGGVFFSVNPGNEVQRRHVPNRFTFAHMRALCPHTHGETQKHMLPYLHRHVMYEESMYHCTLIVSQA